MRHLGLCVILSGTALVFTGCGKFGGSVSSKPQGGIAVVDLDKVAAETGRDRQLAQSLKVAENSLNQQLAKTVENAKGQLEEKQKGYGEEPTEEQKKEFQVLQQSALSQLSQIQNQARIKFAQYKESEIAQYRSELKPIAQEVASKRGLSVVIPKNEGLLLSVDPGVDITDEVIKLVRERHPTPSTTAAAAPATAAPAAPVTQAAATAPAGAEPAELPPAAKPAKRSSTSAKAAGAPRSASKEEDRE